MIKNDVRYIIRRVIIYFTIFFIFSMISSCNVHALDLATDEPLFVASNDNKMQAFYDSNNNNLIFAYNRVQKRSLNLDSKPYLFCRTDNQLYCYALPNTFKIRYGYQNANSVTLWETPYQNYGTMYMYGSSTHGVTNEVNGSNPFFSTNNSVLNYFTNGTWLFNIDLLNYSNNNLEFSQNLFLTQPIENPTLNLIVNKTINDNIVTNYNFELDYSVFDTDNFKYYYKIGDNQRLQVLENNVSFNVNQNSTIYFTIYNNNDELIYSESFTITNLYQYDLDIDNYSVNYNYKNFSVDGNDSSLNKIIDRVTVDFEYFPKRSIYKYQYQFVESGQSLGNWLDLGENEYDKGYTTNVNGTMYNRILDSDNTVLYTSSFNVTSIGQLYLNENTNNNNSFYNKLFSKINYGGSISDIFFLPVELIKVEEQAIREGFCTPVNLGRLFGHDLIMPCLDIESFVGSNIYYFIDMVFTISVIIGIVNFVVDCYNGAIFMEEGFDKAYNKIEGVRK